MKERHPPGLLEGGEERAQVELVDEVAQERRQAVRTDPVTDRGGISRRVSWSYGRKVLVRIPDSRSRQTAPLAVADALLGGAGLGDLGRLFPADLRTPAGIASGVLIETVVRNVTDAGYRIGSVDVTIEAARPRLGDLLDTIRDSIACLLGVESAAVSVKASTGNLIGAEGAGRAIAAEVAVVLEALD